MPSSAVERYLHFLDVRRFGREVSSKSKLFGIVVRIWEGAEQQEKLQLPVVAAIGTSGDGRGGLKGTRERELEAH